MLFADAGFTVPDPTTSITIVIGVIALIVPVAVGLWALARGLKIGGAWLNKGK